MGEYVQLKYLHPDSSEPYEKRVNDYRTLTEKEPYQSIIKRVSPEGRGIIIGTEINCLKRKDIRTLFFIKRFGLVLRNIIIHKYG